MWLQNFNTHRSTDLIPTSFACHRSVSFACAGLCCQGVAWVRPAPLGCLGLAWGCFALLVLRGFGRLRLASSGFPWLILGSLGRAWFAWLRCVCLSVGVAGLSLASPSVAWRRLDSLLLHRVPGCPRQARLSRRDLPWLGVELPLAKSPGFADSAWSRVVSRGFLSL